MCQRISDQQIQAALYGKLQDVANEQDGEAFALVETAGGVLSPAPSGSVQADVFRPLRLPVLLVGDHRLGGIGTTMSAFESLRLRGYDVHSLVLFKDDRYGNLDYLLQHFRSENIRAIGFDSPPEKQSDPSADEAALRRYYDEAARSEGAESIISFLDSKHQERIETLRSDAQRAHDRIWYPFTQHQGRSAKDIVVIDSAYGDNFDTVQNSPLGSGQEGILQPALDGSASWWTQGLGHGNPQLALSAAYAAGRYGHVMFATAVHKPALELADTLIKMHANPRLQKVFYTDNGSTGMEVAVKMALRASCVRYGWNHEEEDVKILGLMGSYHGDTMGVMDCSEPSIYNKKVEWYKPRGCKYNVSVCSRPPLTCH
jgi:dethiobiotin synthetase/adenosylmethionine--8-amino-7-oxononanoate aminotransferase